VPFQFEPTTIPAVIAVTGVSYPDDRGFFMETYRAEEFASHGISASFVQDNQSRSRKGTLRGLHYQIHRPQGKLVRVLVGEVFDVAVDLRRSSRTFLRWVSYRLSAEDRQQLWIPGGFAHGFYVMSEWAEILYKATAYYAPEWERTLRWDDPSIGIQWPLGEGEEPMLSRKDAQAPGLRRAELFD